LKHYPATDVIVSDDGLQHATLMRDIELVVQDTRGVGNGWLLPAGPLRDPPSRLRSIDALITRRTQTERVTQSGGLAPKELAATMYISGFKQLTSGQQLSPDEFVARCANQTLAAYAGIGAPERFFSDLRALGLRVAQTTALSDHHLFNATTLHAPEADIVIITSKDAVKCNTLSDGKIWVAQVHIAFSDPLFDVWLDERLSHIQTALP
jgi:tetraacyldisaccharide 4'-kinase